VPSTSVFTNFYKTSAGLGCGSIRLGLLKGFGIHVVCEMEMTSMMSQMNVLFRFQLEWAMT